MTEVGTVAQLWRYPVKSFQGEQVDELDARARRRRRRPDPRRGRPGRREGAVGQAVRRPAAGLGPARRRRGSSSPCPTAREHASDDAGVHDALSAWLGMDVRLEPPPADGVYPMEMYTGMSDEDTPLFDWTGPPGTWVDLADSHWLTTASLGRHRRRAPRRQWDVRRFRPTGLIETAGDGLPGGGLADLRGRRGPGARC